MIFVWVEEGNKDSQIFAIWVHAKFIERDNDVQSSQILAFLYMSESLIYQWQRIMISFDQSIELSVIDAETQTFVFFSMNKMSETYDAKLKKMNSLFRWLIRYFFIFWSLWSNIW